MFLMWLLELCYSTYPNVDRYTWKFMGELLMYDTNFGGNLAKWEQLKMEEA